MPAPCAPRDRDPRENGDHRLVQWDLFARLVDFHGDVGFAWRLASDLAARGVDVRLWLDDRSDLAWMAPGGAPAVTVAGWADASRAEPGDVVLETFGCGMPDDFLRRMGASLKRPPWIDVEYLSAEAYVERSHGLPSPRAEGPGAGLVEWYYYPGFTPATGGLLREPSWREARLRFDGEAWWSRADLHGDRRPRVGERAVSLFCYDNVGLGRLLTHLSMQPTVLYATAGVAARLVQAQVGAMDRFGELRIVTLPRLTQADYDRLLWSCDLNFVRGEDSFVRAQWAGAPFVWQAYPQHDGAHAAKVEAFLDRMLEAAPSPLASTVRGVFRAWNGLDSWPGRWPNAADWCSHAVAWRESLAVQTDLTTRLLAFAAAKR